MSLAETLQHGMFEEGYGPPLYSKEQQMRNLVKNHDLPDNLPRIKDLEVGSLFRFEDGREYNNVYIKTDQGILFLATGAHYTTHNEERQVHAVKSVTITRA